MRICSNHSKNVFLFVASYLKILCSAYSSDSNFIESHLNPSVIAYLAKDPSICQKLSLIFRFLFLTCATFDPNVDKEFSTTCAMDTDGLYNGGKSEPYHSFSASLYHVENIFLCLAALFNRMNVLNCCTNYFHQIQNENLIGASTLSRTDKRFAFDVFDGWSSHIEFSFVYFPSYLYQSQHA